MKTITFTDKEINHIIISLNIRKGNHQDDMYLLQNEDKEHSINIIRDLEDIQKKLK